MTSAFLPLNDAALQPIECKPLLGKCKVEVYGIQTSTLASVTALGGIMHMFTFYLQLFVWQTLHPTHYKQILHIHYLQCPLCP